MEVIIYDTEFTTWEGAMQSNWGEDWQHREIVQIGAVRFDTEKMLELEAFDILIKPSINNELSDYFSKLTAITQEQVDNLGLSFADGYQEFKNFIGDAKIFSYGRDHTVIEENLKINNIGEAFTGNDISIWFGNNGIDVSKTNSGAIAKSLGIELEMHEHNAIDDARSIVAGLTELISKGAKSPFSNDNEFVKPFILKEEI